MTSRARITVRYRDTTWLPGTHKQAAVLCAQAAAAGLVLVILTWFAAFHIGIFKRADQAILQGFGGLRDQPRVSSLANFIANLCDPQPYVYFCVVPLGVALARRRFSVATAIGAILLGANVTTHLLKPLLAAPRPSTLLVSVPPPGPASWPSGHATAAMALALCCVLAAPARWRPLVAAIGAAFAIAVSYSFLTLLWHFPSDVFGGFLVAGVWTLLGAAALFALQARSEPQAPAAAPARIRRIPITQALAPPAAALLGAVLLAGLVLLARPHEVVVYARVHTTFVVGAVAIAGLGLALATGLMLALRRQGPGEP